MNNQDYPNKISTILDKKMSVVKTQIEEIDETIQSYTKLRIISNQYNNTQTMEGVFQISRQTPWKASRCQLVHSHTCVPSLGWNGQSGTKNWVTTCKGSETYPNATRIRRKNRSRSVRRWKRIYLISGRGTRLKESNRDGLRKPYDKGVENNDWRKSMVDALIQNPFGRRGENTTYCKMWREWTSPQEQVDAKRALVDTLPRNNKNKHAHCKQIDERYTGHH